VIAGEYLLCFHPGRRHARNIAFAPDLHEEIVQVPDVAQAGLPVPEFASIFGTEFSAPVSNSFVSDHDRALRQQILNITGIILFHQIFAK
jgi:hypothetical protein